MIKRALMAAAFAALACALSPAGGAKAMPSAPGTTIQAPVSDVVTPARWNGKHWNRGRYSGRNPGRHRGWYKHRGRHHR